MWESLVQVLALPFSHIPDEWHNHRDILSFSLLFKTWSCSIVSYPPLVVRDIYRNHCNVNGGRKIIYPFPSESTFLHFTRNLNFVQSLFVKWSVLAYSKPFHFIIPNKQALSHFWIAKRFTADRDKGKQTKQAYWNSKTSTFVQQR